MGSFEERNFPIPITQGQEFFVHEIGNLKSREGYNDTGGGGVTERGGEGRRERKERREMRGGR